MRRKLFFYAVILTVAVFLLNQLFPDLWVPKNVSEDEGLKTHSGRVLSIEEKDSYYILVLMDDRGYKVHLNYYGTGDSIGDLIEENIEYTAELELPDQARNPHCFDYRSYLRSRGEYLKGTLKGFTVRTSKSKNPFQTYKRVLFKLKYDFREMIPEDVRGMVVGMIFGDTGSLSEDLYEGFKRNGTAHILAVSGLHIGILYAIYEKMTGGNIGYMNTLVLVFLLLTYGILTTWRPSVIRAELMIVMKTIARIKEFRYDSLTSMSAVAIFLIILNPYVIYDPGFQMSFLAITSIDIMIKVIPEKIPRTIAQTFSVTCTLAIYQAYVFNYISPLSFLINIPIIYLAGIAIPISLMNFSLFGIFCAIGEQGLGILDVIKIPMISMTRMLIKINEMLEMGGHFSYDVVSPPQGLVIFLSAGLLFICSEYAGIMKIRNKRKDLLRLMILILATSMTAGVIMYEPIGHDEIVFVDVGQGACTHVRAGNADILIDGGGSKDRNVGEKTLKPYLLKNGAKNIDLALSTHDDTDHIKGLEELTECFKVEKFKRDSVSGDNFEITEDIYIRTLWPIEASSSKKENEESSVFMIDYMGVKIMVTGDLDEEGEQKMISFYKNIGKEDQLKANVLNVGHHGSKTSTSEELLNIVQPEIAIIQVGRNNYGHPNKEVLERLERRGIIVFRNDLSGAIGLEISKPWGRSKRAELNKIHVMF